MTCVTMNPNMSIYMRLNPRLLVQVGVSLDLLHWVNMSNISLKNQISLSISGGLGPPKVAYN